MLDVLTSKFALECLHQDWNMLIDDGCFPVSQRPEDVDAGGIVACGHGFAGNG
jgi:hypothetical protein